MDKFLEIISSSENVMIVSHIKPDWDAVCSMLAMYDYLKKAYPAKGYGLYLSNEKNPQFDYLEGADKINWVRDISDVVANFDTIIFLDGNSVSRFSNEKEKIDLSKFKTICLDHHPNDPDKFDLDLSDTNAASVTQLVYKLFFRPQQNLLDKKIAEIILVGILGDTGTFRYINHKSSDTLTFAKELIDLGELEVQNVELPMTQMDEEEFELIKIFMENTVKVENSKANFMYSYIPTEFLDKYSLNTIRSAGDKFKVMFVRQIKGYNWGFIITPNSKTQLGISFRSTPGAANVREIAMNFGGGGHVLAAGGYMKVDDKITDSKEACEYLAEFINKSDLKLT